MQTITLTPVNILQIIFLVQSIFSVVLLLPNKINQRLIYLLIASATLMAFNLLEELKVTYDYYLVTPAFSLVFGPLFYLFVRQLALNELTTNLKHFYHLIPALLSLLFTQYVQLVLALGTISQLVYFILSIKLLSVYKRASFEFRSDALSLQLDWLRNILVAMIAITLVDLLRLNLQPHLNLSLAVNWYFTMQLAFYFIMSYLVIQAIWKPSRFTGLEHYLNKLQEEATNKDNAISIFTEIEQIISKEKLFRQPRLSLQDLSQQTGLTSKDISWAINEGCQLNFCDYINQHRIKEIKQTLAENPSSNLLQVAMNAGFNSKSSFNKSFKKQVDMTPSQYVKGLKS